MEIIDSHIHIFSEGDEERFLEEASLSGVTGAVVMGNRSLALKYHIYKGSMRYCAGLDSHTEWKADLNKTYDLLEQHLKRDRCAGIKLYPGYNNHYASDDIYRPIYELAERYKKPVAIHTGETAFSQAQLKYCHPFTLDEVAATFPGVTFVMCHFGNPWFVDAAAVMRKNNNVSADLSGILEGQIDIPAFFSEQAGYIGQMKTWLTYAGAYDRLMFGTDWPLVNIQDYIDFISRIVPEKHHEAVFFGNARRIYG